MRAHSRAPRKKEKRLDPHARVNAPSYTIGGSAPRFTVPITADAAKPYETEFGVYVTPDYLLHPVEQALRRKKQRKWTDSQLATNHKLYNRDFAADEEASRGIEADKSRRVGWKKSNVARNPRLYRSHASFFAAAGEPELEAEPESDDPGPDPAESAVSAQGPLAAPMPAGFALAFRPGAPVPIAQRPLWRVSTEPDNRQQGQQLSPPPKPAAPKAAWSETCLAANKPLYQHRTAAAQDRFAKWSDAQSAA